MPRTKGSPNKITQEMKVFLQHILSDERSNIKSALSELYASNKLQYVQAIIKLLPFVTPKVSELNVKSVERPFTKPTWFDETPIGDVKSTS